MVVDDEFQQLVELADAQALTGVRLAQSVFLIIGKTIGALEYDVLDRETGSRLSWGSFKCCRLLPGRDDPDIKQSFKASNPKRKKDGSGGDGALFQKRKQHYDRCVVLAGNLKSGSSYK
jgi:hypothetical protein